MNTKDKLLAEIGNLISLYTAANMASYRAGVAKCGESVSEFNKIAELDLQADKAFHDKLREIITIIGNEC